MCHAALSEEMPMTKLRVMMSHPSHYWYPGSMRSMMMSRPSLTTARCLPLPLSLPQNPSHYWYPGSMRSMMMSRPILTTARCLLLPLRPTQHPQLALPLILVLMLVLVLVLKQPHYPSQRQPPVYLCLASSTQAGSRRDPVPVRVLELPPDPAQALPFSLWRKHSPASPAHRVHVHASPDWLVTRQALRPTHPHLWLRRRRLRQRRYPNHPHSRQRLPLAQRLMRQRRRCHSYLSWRSPTHRRRRPLSSWPWDRQLLLTSQSRQRCLSKRSPTHHHRRRHRRLSSWPLTAASAETRPG
jgi:hypothetical protein